MWTRLFEWITETDTKEIRFISEMDYSKLNRAQKDKVYDEFAWKPDAYLQSQTFKPEKCLDRLEKFIKDLKKDHISNGLYKKRPSWDLWPYSIAREDLDSEDNPMISRMPMQEFTRFAKLPIYYQGELLTFSKKMQTVRGLYRNSPTNNLIKLEHWSRIYCSLDCLETEHAEQHSLLYVISRIYDMYPHLRNRCDTINLDIVVTSWQIFLSSHATKTAVDNDDLNRTFTEVLKDAYLKSQANNTEYSFFNETIPQSQ